MSDKIRVGFVGAGFMGQLAHLINYVNLPDCEVVALAEPRKKLADEVAGRYGIKEVYDNHIELLKNADVDAIVAVQQFTHHIHMLPDILNAGKALMTEKPIAASPESAEILAGLAKANNVIYMVGYHKRSDPAMEYAKNIIDEWKRSGEYGAMRLVRITMPPGNWAGTIGNEDFISTDEPYPAILRERAPAYFEGAIGKEYLAFVNYYIHQINAMRFLFGESYKVKYAEKSGVMLAVESVSGVCGTLEMAPYNRTADWEENLFVSFEKGYVKVDLPAPLARQQPGVVTIYKDNGVNEPVLIKPVLMQISAMENQARNFIAAVKGIRQVPCGPDEAAEDLRMASDYIKLKHSDLTMEIK